MNSLLSLLFIDPKKKTTTKKECTVQKCIHKMQVFFRNVLTKCEKRLLQPWSVVTSLPAGLGPQLSFNDKMITFFVLLYFCG